MTADAEIQAREAELVRALELPTNPTRAQRRAAARSTAAKFRSDRAVSEKLHTPAVIDRVLLSGDVREVCKLYMNVVDPLGRVPVDRWLEAFARNGRWPGQPDPSRPLRLFRGCPDQYAHGLSWTSDLNVAKYSRDQWRDACVFELNTTWPELVAYIDMSPQWFEYLIDGRLHQVHEVPATRARNSKGRTP